MFTIKLDFIGYQEQYITRYDLVSIQQLSIKNSEAMSSFICLSPYKKTPSHYSDDGKSSCNPPCPG